MGDYGYTGDEAVRYRGDVTVAGIIAMEDTCAMGR